MPSLIILVPAAAFVKIACLCCSALEAAFVTPIKSVKALMTLPTVDANLPRLGTALSNCLLK